MTRVKQKSNTRPATEQPGNSFKYLYWRLSASEFQQLCGAILRNKYEGVRCYPVGMSDGGIDALSGGGVVYQVKWTSKMEQNPHTWLKNTLQSEKVNVRRLVEQNSISRYVLITSVAGTTTSAGTGSIQKLEDYRAQLSDELGIPVDVWWQADLDAEIDIAPDTLKWAYQEMLAGSDAIRYLMHAEQLNDAASAIRDTMIQVMATQSDEDAKIKFSQLEMDRVDVLDLFVDVHATLQAPPRRAIEEFQSRFTDLTYNSGGALSTLLKTPVPLTYLLGVPGQGKSTLGQCLAQVHRAAFLPGLEVDEWDFSAGHDIEHKFPLRIDLKDYALWLAGYDPYELDEEVSQTKPRKRSSRSLENFLAHFCHIASGGRQVTVEQMQSLLERYPTLLILDGLDEIAEARWRSTVVDEINAAATRMSTTNKIRKFQILVTARPNASNLAEPDKNVFQTLQLEPMDQRLQREFVSRWCDVNGLHGRERRNLLRTFADRTSLEHVAQLADNPMQLTILLYLINKKGDAVPVSRTPLYSAYMETLLDREVSRQQINREQVPQVKETTSFLGWHMHAGVEAEPEAGRLSRSQIEDTLVLYFRATGETELNVETLFRATSDRFWALTSKVEGSFEFVVQPVREYFAAQFLAEWAGQDRRQPLSKEAILGHLIERPYWLNTARFYAGFASPNEVASLRYGLEDALNKGTHPLQTRVATWALLVDGIFAGSPRIQRDVVSLLRDDLSVVLITGNPQSKGHFSKLMSSNGGSQLGRIILEQVASAPSRKLNYALLLFLQNYLAVERNEIRDWWQSNLDTSIGTAEQNDWLQIGSRLSMPRIEKASVERLSLASDEDARAALAAGASPDPGSNPDQFLIRAVLDGKCSDVETSSTSEAAALLRAFRPQWFHQLSQEKRRGPVISTGHYWIEERERSKRAGALNRLVAINSEHELLKRAANARAKGQQGTTEPWQNPARILSEFYGPSLLASEIAVAGAASEGTRAEGSANPEGAPFGAQMDYGTLVLKVHRKPALAWWQDTYEQYSDELSRTTWTLAVLATADSTTVVQLLEQIDAHIEKLEASTYYAVVNSSSRLGVMQNSRRLEMLNSTHLRKITPKTRLLVAHFMASLNELDPLLAIPEDSLSECLSGTVADWPIVRALLARLNSQNDRELLQILRSVGSEFSVDLPDRLHLKPQTADQILSEPECYPAALVVAAERVRSTSNHVPNMETQFRDLEWVPKVPRI